MLQIGEKFPVFSLTATISTDKDEAKAFTTITQDSYTGKWKLVFFWPKDFTFVCPTEIAAFGKLNPATSRIVTAVSTASPPTANSCIWPGVSTTPI